MLLFIRYNSTKNLKILRKRDYIMDEKKAYKLIKSVYYKYQFQLFIFVKKMIVHYLL